MARPRDMIAYQRGTWSADDADNCIIVAENGMALCILGDSAGGYAVLDVPSGNFTTAPTAAYGVWTYASTKEIANISPTRNGTAIVVLFTDLTSQVLYLLDNALAQGSS